MKVAPFALERVQSEWEHRVRYNLSESGVQPLSVRALLGDGAALDALVDAPLIYTQTNGTPGLRAAIAALYPGATADHVQVTNGGSEANFVVTWRMVEPGDEVVVLVPAYMQVAGLVPAFGGIVREWPMARGGGRLAARSRSAARRWSPPRPAPSSSARRTTRPARGSPPPTSTPWPRRRTASARGSCPTRSIAAPNATATSRPRCGAAAIASS